MVLSLIIAVLTAVGIILSILFKPEIRIGKLSVGTYWVVALVGAILMLLFKTVTLKTVFESITANTSVNPLKILVLFISMTLFSVFLDELGFFSFMAEKVLVLAKNSQKSLFLYLYLTVSVLTVFTSNDIIILTFTPFICTFCNRSKLDPKPYLFAEFVGANTWSMALLIGNPTNIYIATSQNIAFFEYVKVMLLPTVLSGIVSFLILYLLFRKTLSKTAEVSSVKTQTKIKDKFLLTLGLFVLTVCIILLSISSYIGLEMWSICLFLLVFELVVEVIYLLIKNKSFSVLINSVKRAPYELIPFIISMFVIVTSLVSSGVTEKFTQFLSSTNTAFSYGISSFVTANLINNIPMSVLFSTLLPNELQAVYSTVVGSNLCAILTPVGALAGIMWCNLLKTYEVKFSFKDFIRNGFTVSVPTVVVALTVINIIL